MNRVPALLLCHPDSPSRAVRAVEAHVSLHRDLLLLAFSVEGDLARVRVPSPAPPRCTDGLWRHTCFEAFVATDTSAAYYELNFAPSGEWAVHAFRSYREGGILQWDRDPRITVSAAGSSLRLEAAIPLDALSFPASAPLRLGLSAVIEEEPGLLTFWALQHPPGRPDFHHPDAFALRLAPYTSDD